MKHLATFLVSLPLVFCAPQKSDAGEVTFTEWNAYLDTLTLTYFDTTGSRAVCTVFYKNKPVGANSARLSNGIANVVVTVPSPVVGQKDVTYACRTE